MARIQCAISGITFSCEHLPITLTTKEGYFHPIFALPYKQLYSLYSKHCSGHLTNTDSYLLFLAFLHSTDQIEWNAPCSLNPRETGTIQLVENNLAQLIKVIETTNVITIPSFTQPSFTVYKDNSKLKQISNWIAAWEGNIIDFRDGYAERRTQEDIQKVENKLSYFLRSGTDPAKYASIVASWASKAADFPADKHDAWCKLIRSCFSSSKMFFTPIADIREVKNYCEENIEAGSIHFHSLMDTLREGTNRHINYLGVDDSNAIGYVLLPNEVTQNSVELLAIIAKAPAEAPKRTDYISDLEFLRAKLRYRLAARAVKEKEIKS